MPSDGGASGSTARGGLGDGGHQRPVLSYLKLVLGESEKIAKVTRRRRGGRVARTAPRRPGPRPAPRNKLLPCRHWNDGLAGSIVTRDDRFRTPPDSICCVINRCERSVEGCSPLKRLGFGNQRHIRNRAIRFSPLQQDGAGSDRSQWLKIKPSRSKAANK